MILRVWWRGEWQQLGGVCSLPHCDFCCWPPQHPTLYY